MHLDADDLLHQIQTDWPDQYLISQLRLMVTRQQQEIDRLNKLLPRPTTAYAQPFQDELEVTRNDLTIPS